MKIRVVIVVLAIACTSGYLATVWNSSAVAPSSIAAPALPAEVAALSGVWEGMGPDDHPARLVVEHIRGHWATVSYTWGDYLGGGFDSEWVRVHALVFPDGKLYWRHQGDFTFHLSEDWTALVGKREQGGRAVTALMRRVPAGIALTTANGD